MIDSYSAMKGNLADGKFRALASSGPVRSATTPDLATVQESGVAGYDVVSWNALFAPAGTPPQIVKTLNDALQDALADTGLKKRLLELGIEAKPARRRRFSPAQIRHRQAAKSDREGRDPEAATSFSLPGACFQ
jgi:tripartite-type tricarboxylate transporter receptor subunit TctC